MIKMMKSLILWPLHRYRHWQIKRAYRRQGRSLIMAIAAQYSLKLTVEERKASPFLAKLDDFTAFATAYMVVYFLTRAVQLASLNNKEDNNVT